MNLVKGTLYSKKGLGLTQAETLRVDHIIGGELYSFFTLVGSQDNCVEPDGFVYETSGCHLVPPDVQTDLCRHIFLRKTARADYEYLGKSIGEQRYDNQHNKAFFAGMQRTAKVDTHKST